MVNKPIYPKLCDRFWNKVNRRQKCWLWTAGKNRNGYGRFRFNGEARLAHRLAWQNINGEIPDGMCVCHKCDTPACVNPDHMFIGTRADNVADMIAKGRQSIGHDHSLTVRGTANGCAKITEDEVLAIRNDGGYQRDIARRFGISQAQVWNIINRKQWAHVK